MISLKMVCSRFCTERTCSEYLLFTSCERTWHQQVTFSNEPRRGLVTNAMMALGTYFSLCSSELSIWRNSAESTKWKGRREGGRIKGGGMLCFGMVVLTKESLCVCIFNPWHRKWGSFLCLKAEHVPPFLPAVFLSNENAYFRRRRLTVPLVNLDIHVSQFIHKWNPMKYSWGIL